MSHSTFHSTPFIRILLRITLTLSAISAVLYAGNTQVTAAADPNPEVDNAPTVARVRHRPLYCDHIVRLGVNFLADSLSPPAAFKISMGEAGTNQPARFQIYGITDDERFYQNVTTEWRTTDIRVRAPRGGGNVSGRVNYSEAQNIPIRSYIPSRQTPEDRIAFVDFSYQCFSPWVTYPTRFILTLRGTDRPEPPATEQFGPSQSPPSELPPAYPELTSAWQSGRLTRRARSIPQVTEPCA